MNGLNRDGWDRQGFDIESYNTAGFGRHGFDREGYDVEGFSFQGYDRSGFDREGLSRKTKLPRALFDDEGYDAITGRDVDGYDRVGFDADGYNRLGWDKDGYGCYGYNNRGHNRAGYNADGYSCHHRSHEGKVQPGFFETPDGNVRRNDVYGEGPSAEVLGCAHSMSINDSGDSCVLCLRGWTTYKCTTCAASFCWDCNDWVSKYGDLVEFRVRDTWTFPNNESFGVDDMIARQEKVKVFADSLLVERPEITRRASFGGWEKRAWVIVPPGEWEVGQKAADVLW